MLYLMNKKSWTRCLQSLEFEIGSCNNLFILNEEKSGIVGKNQNLTGFATKFAIMIMFMVLCKVGTFIHRFDWRDIGFFIGISFLSLLLS